MTAEDRPLDRGLPQRGLPQRGVPRRDTSPPDAPLLGAQLSSAQPTTAQPPTAQPSGVQFPGSQLPGGRFAVSRLAGLQFPAAHTPVPPPLTSSLGTTARATDDADRAAGDRAPGDRVPGGTTPWRLPRRPSLVAAVAPLAVLVLLAPVLLLFVRLWHTTTVASDTTLAERAAVAYARPVDKLLAALVDAEYAAARRSTVDSAGVRSAADDVDAADRAADDPLQVRSRWTQLRHEVDAVLDKHASGPDALTAFAAPIALTQALLGQLAESAGATGAPSPGATPLTRVALRDLPDVLVNAGGVTALAVSGAPAAGRTGSLAVVADRLTQAAADVSSGLRAGTDPGVNYAVDLALLSPLDSFSAAADAFAQTVAGLDTPDSGARVDAAGTLLRTKALALQVAVLDTFDNQLASEARGQAAQRREMLFAAVVILAAAVALLWMGVRRRTAPRTGDGYPEFDAGPRTRDLMDARELIGSGLATGGLTTGGGSAAGQR